MISFEWANAKSAEEANRLLAPGTNPDFDETFRPIGGGQDLHTTLKSYIQRPGRVVNLKTIDGLNTIRLGNDGLTLGATATLTAIAEHPDVAASAPGLVDAIHSVASPQIRNLGTIGGNLCQRPRCWYFRLEDRLCLKRGGDTCYAKDGENKFNAIFGTDAPCVIAHPSDPANVLVALDAVVTLQGSKGTRQVKAADFFRMPTVEDPKRETVVADDEFITQIRIPASPLAKRSTYLKFKERESLDFAMASVAAAVDRAEDGSVRVARLVLGGVAQVPWQVPAVEGLLAGKRLDESTIAAAADLAIAEAKPLSQNGYKLPLTRTLVKRALAKLA